MKIYVSILSVVVASTIGLALASAVVLWRSGEMWPIPWVIEHQAKANSIWGLGIYEKEVEYKQNLYRSRKPDIVVVGTSRVLQVRENMFTKSFINLGRGFVSGVDLQGYRNLTNAGFPKFIIWGIDHWWFVKARNDRVDKYRENASRILVKQFDGDIGIEVVPKTMFNLWSLILDDKIDLDTLANVALKGENLPGPRIGLLAQTSNIGGYKADGSYLYLGALREPRTQQQLLANEVKEFQAQKQVYQLPPHAIFDEREAFKLEQYLKFMRRQGSEVLLFIPPMHREVARVMENSAEFAPYINTLTKSLKGIANRTNVVFKNYLNPDILGIDSKCEFYDLIHPTSKAMARIILDLNKFVSHTHRDWINVKALKAQVKRDAPIETYEFDSDIENWIGKPTETLSNCL